jgi:hypothetical protein
MSNKPDDGITDYPSMTEDGKPGWLSILQEQVKANDRMNSEL